MTPMSPASSAARLGYNLSYENHTTSYDSLRSGARCPVADGRRRQAGRGTQECQRRERWYGDAEKREARRATEAQVEEFAARGTRRPFPSECAVRSAGFQIRRTALQS